MENPIAQRQLIAELKTGERIPVTITIGQPYQAGDDHWACPLSVDGLYKQLPDAGGVDSFQALMLAQNLIKTLLKKVQRDGGKLFCEYEDDEEDPLEVDVEVMFSKGL